MRKLLFSATALTIAAAAPAFAGGVPPYSWSLDGASVTFYAMNSDDVLIVSPREGGRQCAGGRDDTWGGFVANLNRDTSNKVYVDVGRQCGSDRVVCVDVEDVRRGERKFIPHVCATLSVEWE